MKNLKLSNHRTDKTKIKLSLITLSLLSAFSQAADLNYISISSTEAGNSQNNGAKGNNSIAIGPSALANASYSVAFGNNASTEQEGDVALGHQAKANGHFISEKSSGKAVAVGSYAKANGLSAVSMGVSTTTRGDYGVSLGFETEALNTFALAVGSYTRATERESTAIGYHAESTQRKALSIGRYAKATARQAVSIGTDTQASGDSSIALGDTSTAGGAGALAMGYKATATQASDIAVGREVRANGQGGAVVYGIQSVATGIAAVAVGSGAKVEGIDGRAVNYAMALGFDAQSTQSGALSMGWSSRAQGESAIAIGHSATSGKNSITLGENAQGVRQYDVVIGQGAKSTGIGNIGAAIVMGKDAVSAGTYSNVIGYEAKSTGHYNAIFGPNAEAQPSPNINPSYASAFGYKAIAHDHRTLAAGAESYAAGDASIALGHQSNASSTNTIAIGKSSVASKPYAVAISTNASASDWYSIAIGSGSVSSGISGLAIGENAKSAARAISIGNNANSSDLASIAIGLDSIVGSGANGIAFGREAKSQNGAIAQGYQANATGRSSIALGNSAITTGEKATSIGIAAAASGTSSVALGEGAKANKTTDIAIGTLTVAEGSYSVGLGTVAKATGLASIAIGNRPTASGDNSIAMGNQTKAEGVRAVSIGHGANATTEDDVALGSYSIASGAQLTDEAKFFVFNDDTRTPRTNFAAYNSRMKGAVAVGVAGFERQIQHVAPGRLSETSTDAVNGSQLYAVMTKSGFNIQQNGTNKSRINNNGLVNFTNGTLTTANITDGDNSSIVKFDVIQGTLTTDTNANTAATKAGVATTTEVATSLNTVRNTPLTFTGNSGTSAVKKLGDSIAITGANGLTTVASANGIEVRIDDDTRKKIDQVVNTEKTEIAAGKNITVTPSTSADKTVYTIDAADTSASVSTTSALSVKANGTTTVNNAQVTDYQIDLSQTTKNDIQKGVDAHNKVTNEGLTFSGDDKAQSAVKKLGDSVAITGDTNIETKGNTDGVQVTLKKDITLDSVTTGKTVMNDSGVKVGNDVSLTNNGLTAGNVSVNTTGINAGNHKITNVEDGDISAGSQDAVNGSQLYQVKNEINTNITKAKTEVQAGKNTEVIANTGANGQTIYTINAKDTSASVSSTDALSVTPNGTKDVGDAQVTDYKIDLSQKTKDEIKQGVDAHETVTNKGLTFTGDSGTSAVKKLGDSVAITGDNNIKTEGNDNGVKVTLNKDVVVDSVTAGKTKISKDGVDAGNNKVVNVAEGDISSTSKDAINGSQLHAVKQDVAKAKTEVVAGKNVVVDGSQTGTDGHQIYTVTARDTSAKITANSTALSVIPKGTETIPDGDNVTEVTEYAVDLSDGTKKDISDAKRDSKDALELAQKGWDITAVAGEGKTVISVGKENVAPGQTMTIEAGKNIVVTHKKDRVMNIAVDTNPTFDNVVSKGDVTVNGTIHANGGLTVAPNQNIDMGGNRITNVAKGVNPTDAVNKSQLDSAINNVNYNINRLDNKIDKVDKKLRAGIAGATAISFLQQPQGAGKSRVSMGVGGYRNEQAIAVGYGRNSDNNKVSFKVGGSVNSRGDLNWGSSVGYEW